MNPGYWLGHGNGPFSPHLVSARLVSRQSLLVNANWIYLKTVEDEIFAGTDSAKPSKLQLQALVDVFNSLGWNPGLRTATKSLNPDAWWNAAMGQASAVMDLLDFLNRTCRTDPQIELLFTVAKDQHGAVPCKREPEDPRHRYHGARPSPYRIRCGFQGCNSSMQRSAVIQWIVSLVDDEELDGDRLVNDLRRGLELEMEDEEPENLDEEAEEDEGV